MFDQPNAVPSRVFNAQTLTAGTSSVSSWLELKDVFNSHSVNGSVSGNGTLKVEYELAHVPQQEFASDQGSLITGVTDGSSDDPFLVALALRGAAYIRFIATETGKANTITVTMYFIQTGRSA